MDISTFQTMPLSNLLIVSLAIGMVFFIISLIAMIVLFGWSMKDTLDHARGMAVFLIAAILTPVGVMSFQQNVISSQAAPSIQILNIETNTIDDQTALFSFDSDVSATIYLEVTDVNTQEMTPILPANNLDKRMSHSFLIPNVENKEIVFSVNGKRFFYEGKPYRIEKQP